MDEKTYEFPNDVYLLDGEFDLTRLTGRGEACIRNAVILRPLAVRYELTGDKVALDLAEGIANHLLGISRYFNWKMEFFGHVHSAVWFAAGLARLGRLSRNREYVDKARKVYAYVRSLSSSFGWVPEYAQWHPMSEEHCETCCIRDMILLASDLIDCGYDEYWTDFDAFARNQLVENQILSGSFVAVDNSIGDTAEATWRDIDKRIVGGYSGGSLPNCISLSKFRSIAGCCIGTAPQAVALVWDRAVQYKRGRATVNVPLDKTVPQAEVTTGYPNEGFIRVKALRDMDVAIRLYPWMPKKLHGLLNGKAKAFRVEDGLAVFRGVRKGATVELRHALRPRKGVEEIAGGKYTTTWLGPDVVAISPKGPSGDLRLYQRVEGRPKRYPKPTKRKTPGRGLYAKPTQQKR